MVDIKVTKQDNDLNEREKNILEVLFLNIAAQANAQITKANMMFNPLDKNKDEDLFYFQFAWQSAITDEQYSELKEGIDQRYRTALKMCNISDCHVTFTENAYLNN